MKRRTALQNIGFSGLAISLLSGFKINDLKADFNINEVRKGVFTYTNKGGTIMFMNTSDGWVVVDTQFPEQSKTLIEELAKIKTAPIGLLINTHHHGDHSGGNIAFKGLVNTVVAHENSLSNQKNVAIARKIEDSQLYPTETYAEMWSKVIGGERVTLRHLGQGHTDGDSWVHFENANVVHTGDMLFNRRHPFVDRTAGASVSSWIDVLEKASNIYETDTKFVFGHSADGYDIVGNKEDLLAFRTYLQQAYRFVESKLDAGTSKDDIKAVKEFPFESQWKGDGINRIISALIDEISA